MVDYPIGHSRVTITYRTQWPIDPEYSWIVLRERGTRRLPHRALSAVGPGLAGRESPTYRAKVPHGTRVTVANTPPLIAPGNA
jgi:hypothetical protein